MKRLLLVAFLLVPTMAHAQISVVAASKTELGITVNPTPAQLLSLVKLIAGKVGGGILPKTTGNNCGGYACDIVCLNGVIYDVLGDSEGIANPQWSPAGPAPVACEPVIGGIPKPPDPTGPPPTTVDLTPIREGLVALAQKLDALQVDVSATKQDVHEHREVSQQELKKARNILTNWQTYVALAAGITGMWGVNTATK